MERDAICDKLRRVPSMHADLLKNIQRGVELRVTLSDQLAQTVCGYARMPPD